VYKRQSLSYYEKQLAKLQEQKERAELNLLRSNFKGGEKMTDKQLRAELDFLKQKQKEEEEIAKITENYQAEQRRKAEEAEKKAREEAEKARKKAEETAKRAAEEQARRQAELRLRELQAQQQAEELRLQNLLAYQKEELNNTNLSAGEKIALQKRIGETEIALLETQNKIKKTQYELDKNNRIQVKKLTKTEIENLDKQSDFAIFQQKLKTQAEIEKTEKEASEKRKKQIDDEMKLRLEAMQKDVEARRKAEEAKLQAEKEAQERRKQILQASYELGVQIINAGFEFERMQSEARLTDLQARKEAELKIAGDSEQAKAIVQAKFANEEKKLKEGQARAEKNKALFDIAVNTATAVIKAIAQSPATFGLPFSAFALAQGAIQTALVASRPIPKFKEGVEYLEGKGTATSDSNLAWLSVGERVISAETNRKYFPVLSAIHQGKVSADLLNAIATQRLRPEIVLAKTENKEIFLLQKQVEKLTKAIATQPKADVNIDKNGFSVFLSDSLEKQEILNSRYSL
jgi:hypothetical protein